MAHIRLIGLLLFITAITLALAAAATRTTHVQVNSQWLLQPVGAEAVGEPVETQSTTTNPAAGSTPAIYTDVQQPSSSDEPLLAHRHSHDWNYATHQSHFDSTAIPIAWPLLGTGAAGLLLWFIQAPTELSSSPKKRSPNRRRR